MKERLTVEPMRPMDAERVLEIYAEGMATGDATFETVVPNWASFDAGHQPDARLIARDGSSVIGWAALSPYSTRAAYRGVAWASVYVDAVARGQGVGRALLEELIRAARVAGIWTLMAGVFVENGPSLALHEHAGFRRVGVLERIGRDALGRWRDVVLLERSGLDLDDTSSPK
jgi:L-amino acid N-acyltransferase YncA